MFPLLYKRNFGQRRGEWILGLAATAVGAAYGGTLESDFRPQMKLIDAKAPLSCSDVAWEDKNLNKAPMWDPKNGTYALPGLVIC